MFHSYRYALSPLSALLFSLSACQSTPPPTTVAQPQATQPAPRTKEFPWMSVARWYEMHSQDVNIANTEQVELLFIGDSITESWDWGEGRDDVYQTHFGQYRAANFGIGGDMTQNLLWRLQHNLDGELNPAVVVAMIGVNNFLHGQHSPEAVAEGVKAVIKQTQKNYPSAKLLLLGILPFHQHADNPSRLTVNATNNQIASLADNKQVFYVNVNQGFFDKQGDIPQTLMHDYIHPTAAGLEIIAREITPIIHPWIVQQRELESETSATAGATQATP